MSRKSRDTWRNNRATNLWPSVLARATTTSLQLYKVNINEGPKHIHMARSLRQYPLRLPPDHAKPNQRSSRRPNMSSSPALKRRAKLTQRIYRVALSTLQANYKERERPQKTPTAPAARSAAFATALSRRGAVPVPAAPTRHVRPTVPWTARNTRATTLWVAHVHGAAKL